MLITGGATGIGRRLAERFAKTGARVAVCDADAAAVEAFSAAHPEMIVRQTEIGRASCRARV